MSARPGITGKSTPFLHTHSGLSDEHKRRWVDHVCLADVTREVEEAIESVVVPSRGGDVFATMMGGGSLWTPPFVGLWREVMHERHLAHPLGRPARWRRNDLQDMFYLGCAAAYADVVVCERGARHYLTEALRRRPAGGAAVVRTLGEAVNHLESALPPPGPPGDRPQGSRDRPR